MEKKKNRSKQRLWRGLAALMATLLALSVTGATVVDGFRTDIDKFLGTSSTRVVSDEADPSTAYGFKSDYANTKERVQLVNNPSGGNQQKVLVAKWMYAEPEIMMLDEPTRGIDVGAKYEIYCIINDMAAEGKSVLMVSSELPELLGMCDRIYVMCEGKLVGELPVAQANQEIRSACWWMGKRWPS